MNSVSVGLLISLAFALPAPGQMGDEAAVREVVNRYVDARDRSAGKSIEALFTSDADQLTSTGEWRKGRDEIVRGTLASSKTNPGTRTITIETVRFPAPGVAIADGRYEIAGAGQAAAAPRRMWTSFLMVRAQNTWRIAAIRNMLPAAPAAPGAAASEEERRARGRASAERETR
jgi:uncharacterized protein (TIGR02246 family)